MKIQRFLSLGALAFIVAAPAQAQDQLRSLDELLNLVEQGRARDNQEEAQRIAEFERAQANQQQLLNDALAQKL